MMFRLLRDATALLVVALFMFPLFWLGLTSIKPAWAMFDPAGIHWFDFPPAFENYALTLSANGPSALNARVAFADTLLVAAGAMLVSLAAGLPAAYGISRIAGRSSLALTRSALFMRAIPPVALAVPLVVFLSGIGLHNTRTGLVLVHGLANLPIAVLVLKSFIDEMPRDAEEAARLDGATNLQLFRHIVVPALRGGITATAVLCFVFSWTECLYAASLSISFKTLPVKLSVLPGDDWGPAAALAVASLLPGFVFIAMLRRHLVRGLTLGLIGRDDRD